MSYYSGRSIVDGARSLCYTGRMNGKDARSLSAEAQEALRMRAVDYYLACGNKSQTARAFGVSRQAVTGWARRYQEGGPRALRKKPQGRPKGGKKLKPWQMA